MTEAAGNAYALHPSLYYAVIQYFESRHDTARQYFAGKEALSRIDLQYAIRGDIALLTAEAALAAGDADMAETCWQNAFESCTSPVNYLRIAAESRTPGSFLAAARRIVEETPPIKNKRAFTWNSASNELRINSLSAFEKDTLRFLTGDFDGAMKLCRSVTGDFWGSFCRWKKAMALRSCQPNRPDTTWIHWKC